MKRAWLLLCLLCLFVWTLPLAAQSPKQLTIESIFADGGLTGRAPETVRWSPDGKRISFVQRDDPGEHGALYFVEAGGGKPAVLVSEEKLASLAPPAGGAANDRERERMMRYSVAGYQWAPDSARLLFRSRGQLWLYSLADGKATQLTSAADPAGDPNISPDGKLLAFTRKHDLYTIPLSGGKEKQLTKTGSDDLLNGEVDWVYAEELSVRSNYFWSPDSSQIAFLEMNEKQVPGHPIVDWIPLEAPVDQQKYPKAGDPNPQVRLGVVKATGGGVKWINVGQPADREYIPRFGWVRPGVIWVQLLNRAQDKLELWFVDVHNGNARKVLTESQPDAWVPVSDMFRLLGDGRFAWPSWRDGHTHLYLYSFNAGDPLAAEAKLERQLTQGNFEVTRLNAVSDQTIYFTATVSNVVDTGPVPEPRERQLLSIRLDGTGLKQHTLASGVHEASFAPGSAHYVDSFSNTARPPSLSLCKVEGDCSPFWQARSLVEYGFYVPRPFELIAADRTTRLYATLLMPFKSKEKAAIPLIVNPYGGPGAQVVMKAWGGANALFDQILLRRGFAVLHVDNRGTAGRGRAFQSASRRNFGEVELADQLAAVDQLVERYPQLDANRIGWWGWSYGGYMTLYAMTHSSRIKAGVAVAPVTDWRDYDSIYTERYMGLPRDNQQAYRNSSPVNNAKDLKGRVLEVHGTSDDNVHLQNTVQMINAMINAGKQFDLQLYPRKTHGIAGAGTRTHLFNRILEHFETYLKAAPAPQP